jgi:probable HAF family extracellular repeat protein
LFCFLLVCGTAGAQTYTVTILDSPGGNLSRAHGINAQHQIVGVGNTSTAFRGHAIQWNNGVPVDLGAGGFEEAEAVAINEPGQVVGWVRGGFAFHAALWAGGNLVELPPLGGGRNVPDTFATAINNAGQIVGSSVPADGAFSHAVLWNGGAPIDLGTLGGPESHATAINEAGQIGG